MFKVGDIVWHKYRGREGFCVVKELRSDWCWLTRLEKHNQNDEWDTSANFIDLKKDNLATYLYG